RCLSVASFISPLALSFHRSVVATRMLVTASPRGRYFVSGSAPRLPTMITLFTDAISYLPGYQFAHARFIPLSSHDLEARDAMLGQHFGLAHAAHGGKRVAQTLEIHSRCDAKRQTRKVVDEACRPSHADRGRQPQPR